MREFTGKALQQLGEIVTARPHLGDTARHLLSQVKHKITTPLTANTVTVGTELTLQHDPIVNHTSLLVGDRVVSTELTIANNYTLAHLSHQ